LKIDRIAKVLSAKTIDILAPWGQKMSLKETIEKIKNLEAEKKNLLLEIEELKKAADAKAAALENEIAGLREEAKTLKMLMEQGQPSVKST
jgi:hypothetical protein